MSDKPRMAFDPDDAPSSFDDQQVRSESERRRVQFSTLLDAGLYEKLKTRAFKDEGKIADAVNEGVRRVVAEAEEARGAEYDVPPELKIDDEAERS